MNCPCSQFQLTGNCYHTGYKPTFRDEQEQPPFVPLAVQRTQQYQAEHRERWEREDAQQA